MVMYEVGNGWGCMCKGTNECLAEWLLGMGAIMDYEMPRVLQALSPGGVCDVAMCAQTMGGSPIAPASLLLELMSPSPLPILLSQVPFLGAAFPGLSTIMTFHCHCRMPPISTLPLAPMGMTEG